jgi:hypothetical protein
MYVSLRSVPKPSHGVAGTGVLNRRRIPPAAPALGVASLLTDVSSQLPSRVRMSGNWALVATTTFVGGHSYAQGSFSTETLIRRNGTNLGNIESWNAAVDGRPLRSVDRNFWAVTFAKDDDTFYASAASGSTTWLMRGSIKEKAWYRSAPTRNARHCRPIKTRIAYKKRLESKGRGMWRLAVLDLQTGQESLLAETRSVDDQAEWPDGNRLLWLPRPGSEATTSDVWVVPAAGIGRPTVFIPEASSPAVVK